MKVTISLEGANTLIEAAQAKARELGIRVCVCVVDESGVLKAFSRMDGAPLMAVGVARLKAVTAAGFGLPTGQAWWSFIEGDPVLREGVHSIPEFTLLGGGAPIRIRGEIAGGIGVSGGHYREDEACVASALAALEPDARQGES